MPVDEKESRDLSQTNQRNLDESGLLQLDSQEQSEVQVKPQEQLIFADILARLSKSLLEDLQDYLQMLLDTDVAQDEKELFSAHKRDQEQAARIRKQLEEVKTRETQTSTAANCLDYFRYWLAVYGGEGTFDSYILVEKHPLWFSIKYLLASAANRQYLSQEDQNITRSFYQNWQQAKEKAIDQELYRELGNKHELRNSLIRDVLSPFGLREFLVGSKSENGKFRVARLLKKMSKISEKSEELMSILQDESMADSGKCIRWIELAQKQSKLKIPRAVKQVVSLIRQIETFEVASEKRRKLHKKLALLQLFALAFPAIPKLIEYSESLVWQVVGLVPSELRMEAYNTILQQVYAFSSRDLGGSTDGLDLVVDEEVEEEDEDKLVEEPADNQIFTAEQQADLQGLYSLENPEYQGIRSLFSTAYEYAGVHGIESTDIYWQRNEEFITLQNIVESNFVIGREEGDADNGGFLSEEQREIYELSGDGFYNVESVQRIISIVHGVEVSPEQVSWYYHDYYNFVFQRFAETSERVDIGEIIGFGIVRNNGSLNLALWDTAIFLKLLTRNSATDFTFSGSSPVSGLSIAELVQEPFISSYTTRDLVASLGEDNLQYWNFAINEGNKDFDPANRSGISYHILFLLALADRIQLSLLIGGVADEERSFATSGEYGENKVHEQVDYVASELGVFGEVLTTAEGNIPSVSNLESELELTLFTASTSEVLTFFTNPELKTEVENQLTQGYVLTFQNGGQAVYARQFGSSISSYVVFADNPQFLSQPLSITELSNASAPNFEGEFRYERIDQTLGLESNYRVVELTSLPQTVVFTTVLDAFADGNSVNELSLPLFNYVQENKRAFIEFVSDIGWDRLHYDSVSDVLLLTWTDLSSEQRSEIVALQAQTLIASYDTIEGLISREELYEILAQEFVSEEDLLWQIISYPEFFIPLLDGLNDETSGLPFASTGLSERLFDLDYRHILFNFDVWQEEYSPQEMFSYLRNSESAYLIFEHLPIFAPVIDKAFFEETLVTEPTLVLGNLDGADLSSVYEGVVPQQALLDDMQRVLPEEYLYYVAANLIFFEPLLYVEVNDALQPTPLLLDVISERPTVFLRNLVLNQESVLHEIVTFEFIEQLFSGEELQRVMLASPEYFAQFLNHQQVVDLLLLDPDTFVYEYWSGWDTILEPNEVIDIMIDNQFQHVILYHPSELIGSVDRIMLESLLTSQENVDIFLNNYYYGWEEIIPEEDLLPLLQSLSSRTDISWAKSVVDIPYVFEDQLRNDVFIDELWNADSQAVADAFYLGNLAEYLTNAQREKLQARLQSSE